MSDQPYYLHQGLPYPRVTNILDHRSKPWLNAWRERVGDDAADEKIKESRRVGHLIHSVVEDIHRGKHTDRLWRMPAEAYEIVNPYLDWFRENVEEVVSVETTVFSHRYRYAGTFDAILKLRGRTLPTLVDLKTSRGASSSWPLQLSAYMQGVQETMNIELDTRMVVHLNKQKPFRVKLYEFPDHEGDFQRWLDLLYAWREWEMEQAETELAEHWENGTGPYAIDDAMFLPCDDDDESRSEHSLLPDEHQQHSAA